MPALAEALAAVRSGLFSPEDPCRYAGLVDDLLHHDHFMVTADFADYARAQRAADALYADPARWGRMTLLNTARVGWFSADRTIREYATEIRQAPMRAGYGRRAGKEGRAMSDRAGTSDGPARPLELDPERATRPERAHYAVVDIGSNSVRLVVYDQLGRAPFPRFNEKSLCRLGEGLDRSGELSPEGFRRTVEATRRFRAIADAMGVGRIDAIATEAIRRASNGERLVAAIREQSGLEVRILSGTEEARYASLGVIAGFYRPRGLVGDMGGGSLEVAEILDDRVGERSVSLPLGALPVQSMLAEGKPEARRRVDQLLKDNLPPALTQPVFYAVGGGWRAFAKAHMAATRRRPSAWSARLRDQRRGRARLRQAALAPAGGQGRGAARRPGRRAATLPSAALVSTAC